MSQPGAPTTPNPLSEAEPDSLAELFARDPEGFTKQDLARVVAELRRKREDWLRAEAESAGQPRRTKPKLAPASATISLDDLQIP